jgi:hypothetical protein
VGFASSGSVGAETLNGRTFSNAENAIRPARYWLKLAAGAKRNSPLAHSRGIDNNPERPDRPAKGCHDCARLPSIVPLLHPCHFAVMRQRWNGVGILEPLPSSGETSSSAGRRPRKHDELCHTLDNRLSIFVMIPIIVCHAQFLKLGVHSFLYVMEGARHGACNW